MRRTIFVAVLDALLALWAVAERAAARMVDRLARQIFGEIDREWVHAEAARARREREVWS